MAEHFTDSKIDRRIVDALQAGPVEIDTPPPEVDALIFYALMREAANNGFVPPSGEVLDEISRSDVQPPAAFADTMRVLSETFTPLPDADPDRTQLPPQH